MVDGSGKAVDLALIRVINSQGKLVETIVSDRRGRFVFNLIKGNYTLHVSKADFIAEEMPLRVKNLADINRIKITLFERSVAE